MHTYMQICLLHSHPSRWLGNRTRTPRQTDVRRGADVGIWYLVSDRGIGERAEQSAVGICRRETFCWFLCTSRGCNEIVVQLRAAKGMFRLANERQ